MKTPSQLINLLYTARRQSWHPQAIADIQAQLEAATGGATGQLSQRQQPAPASKRQRVNTRRGDRRRNSAARPAAAQQPVQQPAAPEWGNHADAWDAPAPTGQPGIEGERRQAASRLQARLAQLPQLPSLDAFDVPAEVLEDLQLHEAQAAAGPSRHAAEADAEHKAWQKLHPHLTAALVGSQAVPAEAHCSCCCRQRPACLECQSCGQLGDPLRLCWQCVLAQHPYAHVHTRTQFCGYRKPLPPELGLDEHGRRIRRGTMSWLLKSMRHVFPWQSCVL